MLESLHLPSGTGMVWINQEELPPTHSQTPPKAFICLPPEVNGPQNPTRRDYNSQPGKKAESNQSKLLARNPSATPPHRLGRPPCDPAGHLSNPHPDPSEQRQSWWKPDIPLTHHIKKKAFCKYNVCGSTRELSMNKGGHTRTHALMHTCTLRAAVMSPILTSF